MKEIATLLAQFCIAKGLEVTKQRIEIVSAALVKRYPVEQVKKAISEIFWESKFFPDASDIAKKIEPTLTDKDIGSDMAGRILEVARSVGEMEPEVAQERMTASEWHAVQRFGGWSVLCRLTYDELGIARAQLRDICQVAHKLIERSPDRLKISGKQHTQLEKPDFQNLIGGAA